VLQRLLSGAVMVCGLLVFQAQQDLLALLEPTEQTAAPAQQDPPDPQALKEFKETLAQLDQLAASDPPDPLALQDLLAHHQLLLIQLALMFLATLLVQHQLLDQLMPLALAHPKFKVVLFILPLLKLTIFLLTIYPVHGEQWVVPLATPYLIVYIAERLKEKKYVNT
jgi:hypothetical protein